MLAPITREAKLVYVLLVMHVDRRDEDNRLAWPTQQRLAYLLGYKRVESIDRYVRELESIGAVTVERGRHPSQPLRKRNYYTVRLAGDPAPTGQTLSVWDVRAGLDEEIPVGDGTLSQSGSVTTDPWVSVMLEASSVPEPDPSRVREPYPDAAGEPARDGVEVEVVDEEPSEEENTLPAPKIGAGVSEIPTEYRYPRKVLEPEAPCSVASCVKGVLKLEVSAAYPWGMCYCPEHYDLKGWLPPWLFKNDYR